MLVAYSSGVVFTSLPCQGTSSQGPFSLATRSAGYSFRRRFSIFYHISFYLSNPIFVSRPDKPYHGRMWIKRYAATGREAVWVADWGKAARNMAAGGWVLVRWFNGKPVLRPTVCGRPMTAPTRFYKLCSMFYSIFQIQSHCPNGLSVYSWLTVGSEYTKTVLINLFWKNREVEKYTMLHYRIHGLYSYIPAPKKTMCYMNK